MEELYVTTHFPAHFLASMAPHRMGTGASGQIHSLHPFTQVSQNCTCTLCWSHHSLHSSSSPSPSKTPAWEGNRDHLRLQQERFPGETNDKFRHGFHPSCCLPQKPPYSSAPCQHFDSLPPPLHPISDGSVLHAAGSHKAFPAPTCFSHSRFNQEKSQEKKHLGMELPSSKGHGSCVVKSNQVTLHKWYLVRCRGSSEGVRVSVGGFFGTAGIESFETAEIVKRLEKCRLLAHDGVEVRLAGLIDDCKTMSNGFSLNFVHSFLSGFPYTWNHLLDNEFRTSNTNHEDYQVLGDCGLTKVSCDHLESPNDTGLIVKQVTTEAQTEQENKDLSTQSASKDNETLEIGTFKDEQFNNSKLTGTSSNDTGPNEKQVTTEPQTTQANEVLRTPSASKDNETSEPTLNDEQINDSDLTSTSPYDAGLNVRQMTTETQNQSASKNDETLETGTLKDEQLNNSNLTGTLEQDVLNSSITDWEELLANVSCDQSKLKAKKKSGKASEAHPHPNITRVGDGTDGTQSVAGNIPFFQLNQSPRITRLMHKLSQHAASGNHTVSDGATIIKQSGPPVQKIASKDGYRQSVRRQKNNRNKVDGAKALKTSRSHYTEGVENPVDMEAQRPERLMKAQASLNSKDSCSTVKEEGALPDIGCNAEAKNRDLPIFVQDSGVLTTSECKTIKDNPKSVKESNSKGNRSKRNSAQCSKRLMIPPPLPCPRVEISKQLVSKAFGLKTSRSGRLLVPPLAHWCGQSVLRDKDGGIIAISDNSKDMKNDGAGSFKFKLPADAGLQKLQKRLCEVAVDRTPTKRMCAIRKTKS